MADILILKGDRPDNRSSAFDSWRALQRVSDTDQYFLEKYSDLTLRIENGHVECVSLTTGRDLASYDLVYLRDVIGYEHERNAVGLYLNYHNRRFINAEVTRFQHLSKLTQYIALAYAGILVPDMLYAHHYSPDIVGRYGLSYPLIMKSIVGSNGSDNVFIKNEAEIIKQTIPHAVLQPFIPNEFDYRVIVAGDEVLLGYRRIRKAGTTEHRNNVAHGAQRELVANVPDDVRDLAVTAARVMRRDLAGVDILTDALTGYSMVLEVNFNFGMSELDDDVAAEYYMRLATYLHHRATI